MRVQRRGDHEVLLSKRYKHKGRNDFLQANLVRNTEAVFTLFGAKQVNKQLLAIFNLQTCQVSANIIVVFDRQYAIIVIIIIIIIIIVTIIHCCCTAFVANDRVKMPAVCNL